MVLYKYTVKRLSQNKLEIASIVSFQIEVIGILSKEKSVQGFCDIGFLMDSSYSYVPYGLHETIVFYSPYIGDSFYSLSNQTIPEDV